MIPTTYYKEIYFIGISILVLVGIFRLLRYGKAVQSNSVKNYVYLGLSTSVLILYVGLRDPFGSFLVLGDTARYSLDYIGLTTSIYPTEASKDVLFFGFMSLSARLFHVTIFYLVCAFIYVGLPVVLLNKWFKNQSYTAFLFVVSSMSYWGYAVNGLRSGLASSIFLLGLALYPRKVFMLLVCLIAVGFHKSMLLPFIIAILALFNPKPKLSFIIWGFMLMFSVTVGPYLESLLSAFAFTDFRVENFFVNQLDGKEVEKGFRLDFVIYSLTGILFGYNAIKRGLANNKLYVYLFNLYTLTNAVWLIVIRAPYTNRVAYLSWFLLPILLAYPLLKTDFYKRPHEKTALVLVLSLLFALFIEFK